MNMVSRVGKLSLPRANESSRQSDSSANAPPGTDTRRTSKHLAWKYYCGGGPVITLLANLLQLRPYDADEAVAICVIGFF
jgi:hypothetical protein